MPKQLSLFDDSGAPRRDRTYGHEYSPCDHRVVEEEKPRLQGQCKEILELLQSRVKITNRELADLALNYRARISDLRAAGYDITCVDRDHKTGLAMYELDESRSQVWYGKVWRG